MKYFIFLLIFILGCNSDVVYEDDGVFEFSKNLIKQSKPDSTIYNYLSYIQDKSPDERLYIIHNKLLNDWNYVADDIDNDTIKNCNDMISAGDFTGDCDDFSVIMFSICTAIGLDPIFCLGVNKEHSGHIWVEVKVCDVEEYDTKLETRLNNIFDINTNIIERDSIVWLQLDQYDMTKQYNIKYIIENDVLIEIEEKNK